MSRLNAVGEGVAARRRELGWSQIDLASAAQRYGWDVDNYLLSKIEAGHRKVSDSEIYWLSVLLDCSIEAFYPPVKTMKKSFLKSNPPKRQSGSSTDR